jgi:carotenoid cleavage dioxygenase-like enzyme
MKLKTLNLARNELCDDSFVYIFEAVAVMLQIQTVDVSGNFCQEMGAEAVKKAIISHSLNFGSRYLVINFVASNLNDLARYLICVHHSWQIVSEGSQYIVEPSRA